MDIYDVHDYDFPESSEEREIRELKAEIIDLKNTLKKIEEYIYDYSTPNDRGGRSMSDKNIKKCLEKIMNLLGYTWR